jgi:hypothetical protein
MAIRRESREKFEAQGRNLTMYHLQLDNMPSDEKPEIVEWLAEFDNAERARIEASQAAQMRAAVSANRAAWIAAVAAIAAAVIGVLAWVFPRH